MLVLLSVLLATWGDIQLAKGLKALDGFCLDAAMKSVEIWMAILILVLQFLFWIAALRRIDLSVAVPLTAINYILSDLLVPWQLHERVGAEQWCGALLIVFGVLMVVGDPEYRHR